MMKSDSSTKKTFSTAGGNEIARITKKQNKSCRFFLKGTCRYGETCNFMHERNVESKCFETLSKEIEKMSMSVKEDMPIVNSMSGSFSLSETALVSNTINSYFSTTLSNLDVIFCCKRGCHILEFIVVKNQNSEESRLLNAYETFLFFCEGRIDIGMLLSTHLGKWKSRDDSHFHIVIDINILKRCIFKNHEHLSTDLTMWFYLMHYVNNSVTMSRCNNCDPLHLIIHEARSVSTRGGNLFTICNSEDGMALDFIVNERMINWFYFHGDYNQQWRIRFTKDGDTINPAEKYILIAYTTQLSNFEFKDIIDNSIEVCISCKLKRQEWEIVCPINQASHMTIEIISNRQTPNRWLLFPSRLFAKFQSVDANMELLSRLYVLQRYHTYGKAFPLGTLQEIRDEPLPTNDYYEIDLQMLLSEAERIVKKPVGFINYFQTLNSDFELLEHSSMPIIALKYTGCEFNEKIYDHIKQAIPLLEAIANEFHINGHLVLPNSSTAFFDETVFKVMDSDWCNIVGYIIMEPSQFIACYGGNVQSWIENYEHSDVAKRKIFT